MQVSERRIRRCVRWASLPEADEPVIEEGVGRIAEMPNGGVHSAGFRVQARQPQGIARREKEAAQPVTGACQVD